MNCAVHPNIPASAYCRTCGKALCESCKRDVKGVIFCQDCLAARLEGAVPPAAALPPGMVVPPPPLPEGVPNPAVALVLGFIPGVGAFYNGQFAKGFIHVVIFAILIKLADASDMFGVMIADTLRSDSTWKSSGTGSKCGNSILCSTGLSARKCGIRQHQRLQASTERFSARQPRSARRPDSYWSGCAVLA